MSDPGAVRGYHAHIYYAAATKTQAAALRAEIAGRFPQALLGRWHDEPVGPHPVSMYQIAFASELFPALVPYLMLHRHDLTVLVHPETGNAYRDHSRHALWLGQVLPLALDRLPGDRD
jgi:aromatic ring-cleaving dioxygenase